MRSGILESILPVRGMEQTSEVLIESELRRRGNDGPQQGLPGGNYNGEDSVDMPEDSRVRGYE